MKLSWKPSVSAAKKRRKLVSQTIEIFDSETHATLGNEEVFHTNDSVRSSDTSNQKEKLDSNSSLEQSKLLQEEGNRLAEGGDFSSALEKWEMAIFLTPERAVLHEQKAQILLEMNSIWNALQAATRAVELDSNWAEAYVTLARCQLNYGEPVIALKNFAFAETLKPEMDMSSEITQARHLVAKQQTLTRTHISNSNSSVTLAHSIHPRRALVTEDLEPLISDAPEHVKVKNQSECEVNMEKSAAA